MTKFDFSIIKFLPDSQRGEVLNIGIIVYLASGVDVRILQSVSKLKAFDYKITLEKIESFIEDIEWVARGIRNPEQLHKIFQGELSVSKPGYFKITTNIEYEIKISELMNKFVNPIKGKKKKYRKRIVTDIKSIFHEKGILGNSLSEINDHKVVTSYPIAENEGLFAEFLLKNGAYHLTETLDLRTEQNRAKLGESALKAITINKAKELFNNNLKSFVIFAADNISQENNSKHQLKLLEDHTDKLYNLCSKEDMAHYYEHMLTAANSNMNVSH